MMEAKTNTHHKGTKTPGKYLKKTYLKIFNEAKKAKIEFVICQNDFGKI